MKKSNYIKMSFMGATNFLGKRIKLENNSSKIIFNIPLHWAMSDYPYLNSIRALFIMNNIKFTDYIELKNNEFIFIVENDSIDLKEIDII